jgi:hypothetical protein
MNILSQDSAARRWWPLAALLTLAVTLSACAAAPPEGEEQPQIEEDLATILSEPLDAEEYGESQRCVSSLALRNFELLGDRHILFEGPRGRYWLNELRMRCPGLRSGPASALVFDSRGGGAQVCSLDRFAVTPWFYDPRPRRWWQRRSAFDRGLPPDAIPCTLGAFQPISADQAEAIRAAFDQR